jgi:hypothetical protein
VTFGCELDRLVMWSFGSCRPSDQISKIIESGNNLIYLLNTVLGFSRVKLESLSVES